MTLAAQFDEQYFASVYGNYFRQNPKRKLRFYHRLLHQHLLPCPSPRVLDLGCAFGMFLSGLPREFTKFGVDASHHALSVASVRTPNANFLLADCGNPPIRAQFNAITAFDVLEHIPALDETLDFVRRSLSPNGVFVFVVPVYDGPLGPVIQFLDRDPTHVHKQSRDWWIDKASRDFEVISWVGILRYLVGGRFYVHIPSRSIRGVAPAIAVVAKLKRRSL